MRSASTPPRWFLLCVAGVVALGLSHTSAGTGIPSDGAGDGPQTTYAFFGFLVAIAGAIWNGIQVAAKVTLAALSWSVKALWFFAQKVANGLAALGKDVLTGLRKAWGFFEWTYARVLKPAILKFWRWFDRFRKWLDDTFAPVFKFLRDVRDHVMAFYKAWIRPWLDLIDISRRVLRIFGAMGLEWARALDRRLGELADAIDRPFRMVLAEINKVINIVNRIVTADGLFQRLTLIRSIGRDLALILNSMANARSKPLTAAERDDMRKRMKGRPLAEIVREKETYFATGGGPSQPLIDEQVLIARQILQR